jgi:hypothetical protein
VKSVHISPTAHTGLVTVLADVDAVVAAVQYGQALLLAFNTLGLIRDAGAVVAENIGARAAPNPFPAEIRTPEDVVAVAVERAAGGDIVVSLGAIWKRSARHRRAEGSCGEAQKSEGGVGELHLASAGKSRGIVGRLEGRVENGRFVCG